MSWHKLKQGSEQAPPNPIEGISEISPRCPPTYTIQFISLSLLFPSAVILSPSSVITAAAAIMDDTTARSALDSFEIITASGILLWSKKYAPVNPSVVNSFISDVLIEGRVQPGTDGKYYKKDSYTLKWTTANDFGLIFIVRICPRDLFLIEKTMLTSISFLFSGCLPIAFATHLDRRAFGHR
jgi:hypothetical protein